MSGPCGNTKQGAAPSHTIREIRDSASARGTGAGQVYWYLVYKLKNPYKVDREVYVNVTATIDGKKKYADIFLPSVERAAEKRERRELWGRTDQFRRLARQDPSDPKYGYTTLKAGEERDCIAIFDRIDPNVNRVIIEVAGLSNEIREKTDDAGGKVLIERIRQVSYQRHGDEFGVTRDSFEFKGTKWIEREVPAAPKG